MKKIISKKIKTALLILCTVASLQYAYSNGKKDAAIEDPNGILQEEITDTPSTEELEKPAIAYSHDLPKGDSVKFHEVWAYILDGHSDGLTDDMNITDLCLFSAGVNVYGEINYVPDSSQIKKFKGRKHLIVTCDSRSLTHFILDPDYGVRQKLISRLVKISKDFDGLQIDFELVPARDEKNFQTFLLDVRGRIGREKWFSVALPARTKTLSDDVYDYDKISSCVDRIIVMAYDEHWSGSKPGPVASMDWCEKVADYASSVIPQKKLVMGLPFYGRTWVDDSLDSAWRFKGINNMFNERNMHTVTRDERGIPTFTFTTQVTVTGYFDDSFSLVERCRMYESKNIKKTAFWRIGQEDSTFWPWLELN
ncbi:MAG: glycosyl hydrolase family 18 protein [Treponema sp.]